jgi:putative protein-disulfide isomerase
LRGEILQHWYAVQRRTGQPFRFDAALPLGFVYDTEPACRAVVSMISLERRAAFAYFRALQRAFYAEQQDITRGDVLAGIAREFAIEEDSFRVRWGSDEMRARTRRHFAFAREVGVRGFPTIILGDQRGYRLLTHGYQPFDALRREIEDWLTGVSTPVH